MQAAVQANLSLHNRRLICALGLSSPDAQITLLFKSCKAVTTQCILFVVADITMASKSTDTDVMLQRADESDAPLERSDRQLGDVEEELGESHVETALDGTDASGKRWHANCFMQPLALVSQLSGYPNLLMLYSILCCLPVSSASAERIMSKLKLVKNRLRTSLTDDSLSALLILASEKDLLMQLSTDEIISRFALTVPALRSHLMY